MLAPAFGDELGEERICPTDGGEHSNLCYEVYILFTGEGELSNGLCIGVIQDACWVLNKQPEWIRLEFGGHAQDSRVMAIVWLLTAVQLVRYRGPAFKSARRESGTFHSARSTCK